MAITPELFKISSSNFQHFLSFMEATKCVKFQSAWCTGFEVGIFWISPIEPAHVKMALITKASREGSGEPVHPCSLARAYLHKHYRELEEASYRELEI